MVKPAILARARDREGFGYIQGMRNGYIVVDGHAHVFSSQPVAAKIMDSFNERFAIDFDNSGDGTVENLLAGMGENGIDLTVLANFAGPRFIHETNLWTLATARAHPAKRDLAACGLIPLVSFCPELLAEHNSDTLFADYLARGARGVKLHPMSQGFDAGDAVMLPVYALAGQHGLPVVFHCGRVSNARINEYSDFDRLIDIVDEFPDTDFVLTHMVDGNEHDLLEAARRPNVWFDTSIVVSGHAALLAVNEPSWQDDERFVAIVAKVGARRFLFGSDHPWGAAAADLARFLAMPLDDADKRMILGTNALGLFLRETVANPENTPR